MATPAVVGNFAADGGNANVTSLGATLGTVLDNDVAEFTVSSSRGAGAFTGNAPSGWSPVAGGSGGDTTASATCTTQIWRKTLTAADSGTTVTCTALSGRMTIAGVVVRGGVHEQVSAVKTTATGASPADLGITPIAPDCLRLFFLSFDPPSGTLSTVTPPTGFTEEIEREATASTTFKLGAYVASKALSGQAGVPQGAATATMTNGVNANSYAVTIAPAGHTVAVTMATETDSALSIGKAKTRAIGTVVEADSSLGIGVRRAATLAGETDSALALGRRKTRAVGISAETDTARGIGDSRTVALAAETDTAGAISRRKTRTVGSATEADTAQPIGRTKRITVVTAPETDTAPGLGRRKTRQLVAATEADTAGAVSRPGSFTAAVETDTALPIGRRKTRSIGTATETDTAQALPRRKTKLITVATEGDFSTALTRGHRRALTRASELDTAVPIGQHKTQLLGTVTEIDVAGGITHGTPVENRKLYVTVTEHTRRLEVTEHGRGLDVLEHSRGLDITEHARGLDIAEHARTLTIIDRS